MSFSTAVSNRLRVWCSLETVSRCTVMELSSDVTVRADRSNWFSSRAERAIADLRDIIEKAATQEQAVT